MLSVQTLKLQNFCKIKEAEIHFNQGATLICGNPGQGKSAAIDALALCLLEYKRGDTFKDYVRKGSKEAHITLIGTLSNEPIEFNIKLTAGQSAAGKEVKYKNVVYKGSEVKQLLADYNLEFYGNIIFSMQDSDNLSKFTPSELLGYLAQLLSFDFSDKIAILDDTISKHNKDKEAKEHEITFTKNIITKKETEFLTEKPLPLTKRLYDGFQEEQKRLSEEYQTYVQTLAENEIIHNAIQKLQEDLIQQEKEVASKHSEIVKLEQENKSLETKLEQVKTITLDLEETKIELAGIPEEIKTFQKSMKSIRETNDGIHQEVSEIEQKVETNNKTLITLKTKQAAIVEMIDLIKKGKCPICKRETTSLQNEIKTNELEEVSKSIQFTEEENKTHDFNINEKKNNIRLADLEIYKAETNIADLEKRTKTLTDKIELQTKQLDALPREHQIEKNNKKIIEFTEEEKDLVLERTKLETLYAEKQLQLKIVAKDDMQKCKEQIQDIETKLSLQNEAVLYNTQVKETNEKITKTITESKEAIEFLTKDIEKAEVEIALQKEAKEFLNKILPNYMAVRTCAALEYEMNCFIQSVFPNMLVKLYTNKKGVDFFYSIEKKTLSEPIDKDQLISIKMASGFEKAILTLAFKIALCKAYHLPLAVLDEVDCFASDTASQTIFDVIINSNILQQAIIISHQENTREYIRTLNNVVCYVVNNGEYTEE